METSASSHNRQQLSNHSDDSENALLPSNSVEIEPENYAKWRKLTTVAILCFINLINYMDRFTLAGILTDIKDDFDIGDDRVGLLQTVFVISYMIFAPLFGYLGDRQSRTKIMAAGIFLWSLTTLIGSFMTNFWWFIFFRALVGVGEASYSTIAPTIISDLFVKDVRSKMLAVFYFAIPVGSGLGYIVGSEAAKAFGGWQWGLRVTPVLGAVAVILMQVVMRDPQRGQAEGGTHVRTGSYKDDIKALAKNTSFMLSTAGFTCVAFVAGALAWWGPQFIFLGLKLQAEDSGSVSFSDVSYKFGLVSMAAGIVGVPLGSLIAQRLRPRYPDCDPIICGFGLITSAPIVFLALVLASSHAMWCLTLVFLGEVFLNLTWSIIADMLLYVVIPTRRSTAEAFQILVSHAFGDAGSPYLVGVISEALKIYLLPGQSKSVANFAVDNSTVVKTVFEDDTVNFKALQYALFTTSFVEVLGGALFLVTALYIVKDKMRVEKVVSESSAQPTHRFAEDIESRPQVVNINL